MTKRPYQNHSYVVDYDYDLNVPHPVECFHIDFAAVVMDAFRRGDRDRKNFLQYLRYTVEFISSHRRM